jgi:aryl-alcohol dehydrogenase-like predicted oxidoreductase
MLERRYNATQPKGDEGMQTGNEPTGSHPCSNDLGVHEKHHYGMLAGIDTPICRLVMGVDHQVQRSHAFRLFDVFFERGGNCFDTAFKYRDGMCEQLLGDWIAFHGIRDQVVLLDKGAHTPECYPAVIEPQLMASLQRLQTSCIDLYMLHRDNPEVPVGEFITALNAQQKAGRIRLFGASNWSLSRICEANCWANEHGMYGFSAISNHFSLATMVRPAWTGCVASQDAAARAWFLQTQMPLFPWSSQAHGFFADQSRPQDVSRPVLVRGWYSQDNFHRLERARQKASQCGVLPTVVALAYVLHQPFPIFPLIGARLPEHIYSAFQALDLSLSEQEMCWLNLEAI